jgi:RNA polymerase sigma factor (sigma-70 family)
VNAARIQSLAIHIGKPQQSTLKSVSDADLLTRFVDYHDEAAFEELVGRHLPSVRAICRSVLRNANDVDDAAQATFLVLVRRASVVRHRLALGSWLCRIAWRTANRLRESNMRRSEKLIPGLDPDTTPARPTSAASNELVQAIQDEIRLLPERYRLAVLTCYCSNPSR